MRWFAWSLMIVGAMTLGCSEQPEETIPAVTPSSSGVSGDHDHDGHDHGAEGDHADHDHGDHEHGDHDHGDAGGEQGEAEEGEANAEESLPTDESASVAPANVIRFVADKRLSVPNMSCPYSCWPTVQETLAAQPGVEGVQLAEQPAGTPEGQITERVVELKLNGDFDLKAAIAALGAVDFKAEAVN